MVLAARKIFRAGRGLACALALASVTGPAWADFDQEAQRACEDKAAKHEPPLSSVDWEAFMADCLADATAGKKE